MYDYFEKAFEKLESGIMGDIMHDIGTAMNSFSPKYADFFSRLHESGAAKERFEKLMLAIAGAHGYQYMIEEKISNCPHWDDRDKASRYACYKSFDNLGEMYRNLTGSPLFREDRTLERVSFDLDIGVKKSGLEPEISYFLYTEHPTIRQSIIRMFVRYCEENEINVFACDVAMPFI